MAKVKKHETEIWFRPDRDDMLREMEEQSDMTVALFKALADAQAEHAHLKEKLEVWEAEIAADVRANPQSYNIEGRATDKAVAEAITRNKKRQKLAAELIEAGRSIGYCKAGTMGIQDKCKMIEGLVYAEGRMWHAEPKIYGEKGESMKERSRKKNRSKVSRDELEDDE
jgi:hypothetical protein